MLQKRPVKSPGRKHHMYYYLVQGYLVSATDALPPGGPVWGPAVLWPYNRLASVLPCGPKRDA